MADYTIYKTANGVIESCGSTNVGIDQINLESHQSIIEGIYEVEKYKILSGSAVEQSVDFWSQVRIERDTLLLECDWTQTLDSPLTDSKKAEWVTYRQALRDLPTSYSDSDDIEDVVFPTPPS